MTGTLPAGFGKFSTEERQRRRVLFNEIPEIYDAARPRYPEALYDQLFAWLGDPPGDGWNVVEIGSGTGQATLPLLQRGCRITAVELGDKTAAFLRHRLTDWGSQLNVVNTSFEELEAPDSSVDLIAAATSFHWVEPTEGLKKAHRILKPRGVIALWGIAHVHSETQPNFGEESQPIYRQFQVGDPKWAPHESRPAATSTYRAGLEESDLFDSIVEFRADADREYTSEQYRLLLQTDSQIRQLEEPRQAPFIDSIVKLIDERFGGKVTVPGVAIMVCARAVNF